VFGVNGDGLLLWRHCPLIVCARESASALT